MSSAISALTLSSLSLRAAGGRVSGLGHLLLCLKAQQCQQSVHPSHKREDGSIGEHPLWVALPAAAARCILPVP